MRLLGLAFHWCILKCDVLTIEMKYPNTVEYDNMGGKCFVFKNMKTYGIKETVFEKLDELFEFKILNMIPVDRTLRDKNPRKEDKTRVYYRD